MHKYLILTGLLIMPVLTGFPQSYTIGLNLKNNDRFRTNIMVETSMEQTVMGIEQNIDMNTEMSFNHQVVTNNENKGYELISEYRRMYLNINYTFDKVIIDTDRHESTDLLSNMMKKLMNRSFSIFLSESGEITEVNGFEKYFREITGDLEIDTTVRNMLTQELRNSMGEELIRQNFTHFFGFYPSEPVKKSDSWNISYSVDQSGYKLLFNGKGTLVEITPKTFLIRVDGIIVQMADDQNLTTKDFSLVGKQISEILIDRRNGWPLKSTVTQDIAGILIINESPDDPGKVEVPMHMKMRMNMSSGE